MRQAVRLLLFGSVALASVTACGDKNEGSADAAPSDATPSDATPSDATESGDGGAPDAAPDAGCTGLLGLVIINEINADESSAESESDLTNRLSFIELRGVANQSLEGAEIQLLNGNGGGHTAGSPISLDGSSIPADGLMVVGEADVPNRDIDINDLGIQNGPDNIVLVDACGNTVDAVGYGSFGVGDTFLGEAMAVDVPAGASTLGRRPAENLTGAGGADTDNNAADFCVITPPAGGQAGNAGLATPDTGDAVCPAI